MQVRIIQNPSNYKLPIGSPIYFDPDYSRIQDHRNLYLVQTVDEKFTLLGTLENKIFTSLPRSPFGGILTTLKDFEKAFKAAIGELHNLGATSIEITLPPVLYSNFPGTDFYEKNGFQTLYTDYNQHINLLEEISFHKMELRRLKKAEQNFLFFTETREIENVHSFLEKCRYQQGLKLNIDQERLLKLFEVFSDRYRAWVVRDDYKWLAALVTVHVTKDIVYYFLPGSDKSFHKLSPMVFLIENLLQVLKKEGIRTLDMGISSIKGKKQQGLFTFKERLGAISTLKPTIFREI